MAITPLPLYLPAECGYSCLLYTSDAADERSSVDLGGRRIIKKKKTADVHGLLLVPQQTLHSTTSTTQE